jgi:uncharacterized protein (DUF362 family)
MVMLYPVVRSTKRLFLALSLFGLALAQFPSCGSGGGKGSSPSGGSGGSRSTGAGGTEGTAGSSSSASTIGTGGNTSASGAISSNGGSAAGGKTGAGGSTGTGEKASTGGSIGSGGSSGNGGNSGAGSTGGATTNSSENYVVAMVQSAKAQAADITQDDVVEMVKNAVAQAGGLDFIKDGQTVVLKPNIVTPYQDYMKTVMPLTVNGVSTDWRVTKAVADLVRAKNPKGKILVMEGATVPAATAFSLMGYTAANFGTAVDEFVAMEGASCSDRSENGLVQKSAGGKTFWFNKRYATADVVISLPTLKTHISAGITGAMKSLGIGGTPVGKYAAAPAADAGAGLGVSADDCTRGMTAEYIDHSTPETLGQFIADFYAVRTADFVVMDGLQGLQNGPASYWARTDYATDKMNMRLILAGKNAVAVDTIEAVVMKCDPKKVPHLTKLEASGLGTTDLSKISVVGKQPSEVAKAFAGKLTDICPGQ